MTKRVPPFLRSAFNYDTDIVSAETGLECLDPSLAQQQFKDDNDPNVIMERFARTNDMSLLQGAGSPQFGDFVDATDYRTSLNRVLAAQDFFNQLSANVRARFHNDPAEFLDFFNDSKNLSEAIKLGLMKEGTTLSPESPLAPAITPSKGDKGDLPPA